MRFSLFGFPVHVRPFFWLVGLALSPPESLAPEQLARCAAWLAIVFVSILVHELGHAVVMRAFGRTPSIELWGLGGLTFWGEGPRVAGWKRALVSMSGPGAGFVLAIPFVIAAMTGVTSEGTLAHELLWQVLFVNVIWGALNLLPILPLDGGHVMEVALTSAVGEKGPRLARIASIAVAALGAGVAFTYGETWAAFIAVMAGARSFRELGMPIVDAAIPATAKPSAESDRALDEAWESIRGGRAREAIDVTEQRLAALPDDEASAPERARMLETIAWAHLEIGDEKDAIAIARRMPPRFAPSALLAARLLIASGKTAEGFRDLERAYLDTPGDLPALVLAAAWIDHRAPERAVAILKGLRGMRVSTQGHLVISAALFYDEHYAHALAVSELAWNRFTDPTHAYNAACSLARLGRIEEGIDHLDTAIRAGFTDALKIADDPDLAPLRVHPRFPALEARAQRGT